MFYLKTRNDNGLLNGNISIKPNPNPNSLFIVEVHLALKLVHRHSTFETNLTG